MSREAAHPPCSAPGTQSSWFPLESSTQLSDAAGPKHLILIAIRGDQGRVFGQQSTFAEWTAARKAPRPGLALLPAALAPRPAPAAQVRVHSRGVDEVVVAAQHDSDPASLPEPMRQVLEKERGGVPAGRARDTNMRRQSAGGNSSKKHFCLLCGTRSLGSTVDQAEQTCTLKTCTWRS